MALSRAVLCMAAVGCITGARFNRQRKDGNERYVRSSRAGHFQAYWPETEQASCDAVLFAVGTAMSAKEYPDFAQALVAKGMAVVIVDAEPGRMTKLNAKKLTTAFAYAKENVPGWSTTCGSIKTVLVGGHSAGGATAHKVVEANADIADGVFSVDPFPRGDFGGEIALPGLYWGFSEGSCFVDPKDSAQKGYSLTPAGKRVLAVVESKDKDYYHCSISKGCGIACNNGKKGTPDAFFTDVADSVEQFTSAVKTQNWGSLRKITRSTETPITWFVGDDLP